MEVKILQLEVQTQKLTRGLTLIGRMIMDEEYNDDDDDDEKVEGRSIS